MRPGDTALAALAGDHGSRGRRSAGRLTLAAAALLVVVAAAPAGAASGDCVTQGDTVTCTFTAAGGPQSITTPAGANTIQVSARGAAGAAGSGEPGSPGGLGAQVDGTLAVTPGTLVTVVVGGQPTSSSLCIIDGINCVGGVNGGGSSLGGGGGGGGASDVRIGGTGLGSRVLVAAGGGGAGWGGECASPAAGGAGGAAGRAGGAGAGCEGVGGGAGGGAGTATGGGAGGAPLGGPGIPGIGGSLGGGDFGAVGAGGGGGGGAFGGGAGGSGTRTFSAFPAGGGGGGGSSLVPPGGALGVASDPAGQVVITFSLSRCSLQAGLVSCSYASVGSTETFIVPPGITSVQVRARGAAGGAGSGSYGEDWGGPGGRGAQASATLPVTAGGILTLTVGGGPSSDECAGSVRCNGGFNGGADGGIGVDKGRPAGAGGGGATDIRVGGTDLSDRILVAGGGGGGGSSVAPPCPGGAGGDAGVAGQSQPTLCIDYNLGPGSGAGGSQGGPTAGGQTGGGLGVGGEPSFDSTWAGAGGGGGGLFGGGGGGTSYRAAGGGGGGSSLVPTGGALTLAPAGAAPAIVLSYALPGSHSVSVGGRAVAPKGGRWAPLRVPVCLEARPRTKVSVRVTTVAGTALRGLHYRHRDTRLRWSPGAARCRTVQVAVTGRRPSIDRRFQVRLSSPTGRLVLARRSARVTLLGRS